VHRRFGNRGPVTLKHHGARPASLGYPLAGDRGNCRKAPDLFKPERRGGSLGIGETAVKHLTFSNRSEEGVWHIAVPPGSQLTVRTIDTYPGVYPDEWYIELKDQDTRLTRAVAFPATNNAPVTGTIASGNATVLVHYFGGPARFPAGVSLTFTCTELKAPTTISSLPKAILEYPIIVIYSASWATLIALAVVIFWAHKRRNKP